MAVRLPLAMSGREFDLDDLFDRDADSRLLERRRREELGLAPQRAPASSTPVRFGAESMVNDDERPAAPRNAVLRVAIVARPNRELIPGAIVTVVVSLHDDGDADAGDVRMRVVLPPEAEALPGSFSRDEVELDGEALLAGGLRVGTVAAGAELRIRFALRVLPGTAPLDIAVHAGAPGVPTISAPTLRLARRSGHAAFEQPRPFFELESGEADDALTSLAASTAGVERVFDALVDEPAVPAVVEREREPSVTPAPARPRKPKAKLKPKPKPKPRPKREPAAEPKPEPAPEAEPSAREFALIRGLDLEEVRALERVFSGGVPHGLAGLALLSSIAAVEAPVGTSLGLRDFARSVAAALPRALVAARMQQATPPVVTREALGTIRPHALAPAGHVTGDGPVLALRLDERGLDGLRAVLGRDLDDIFLRGVQVLLAVCPRALEGVAPEAAERAGRGPRDVSRRRRRVADARHRTTRRRSCLRSAHRRRPLVARRRPRAGRIAPRRGGVKLLIGIPTNGQPTRPFLDSLRELTLPAGVDEADRVVWTGNLVAAQREMIAREAVDRGADLLAMIDDDIVTPPDALVRLVEALEAHPQAAVAGALYYSRDSARPMAVARWDSRDTTSAAIPAYAGTTVARVDGVGFGCVVVRIAALRALSLPYFAAHAFIDRASRVVRQCDEDYLLCERMRAAGWQVLLHAGVRVGHYDRATQTTAPAHWETDAETDRLRMIVLEPGGTRLVPFDDTVPRDAERHEPIEMTLLFPGRRTSPSG